MNNRNAPMKNRNAIRIAIAGVGNCASSLIQGIHYYTRGTLSPGRVRLDAHGDRRLPAVRHRGRGGFRCRCPQGRHGCQSGHLRQAQLHEGFPADIPDSGVMVRMGQVLDGISEHMAAYAEDRTFVRSDVHWN